MPSIHMKSGRDTTLRKTMQRLSLKHWSTKTVIFSAESWPCFQIELAAGGQSGLRVNVLTMIVYPALLHCSIAPLLFCRLKILCVFLLPFSRKTEPPRFRQRLERYRKPSGENPRPPSLQHRRSTTTYQPHGCLFRANGLCRGWRGSWRPESPWLGVSARLTS